MPTSSTTTTTTTTTVEKLVEVIFGFVTKKETSEEPPSSLSLSRSALSVNHTRTHTVSSPTSQQYAISCCRAYLPTYLPYSLRQTCCSTLLLSFSFYHSNTQSQTHCFFLFHTHWQMRLSLSLLHSFWLSHLFSVSYTRNPTTRGFDKGYKIDSTKEKMQAMIQKPVWRNK